MKKVVCEEYRVQSSEILASNNTDSFFAIYILCTLHSVLFRFIRVREEGLIPKFD